MTLGALEAVMSVINVAPKKKRLGRTAIQKLLYFGMIKNLVKAEYRPHYYGPYSADVADALQTVTGIHFVSEGVDVNENKQVNDTFEWRRYSYSVTPDGQKVNDFLKTKYPDEYKEMKKLVEICEKTANLDPQILSWAAKVHYIIKQEDSPMRYSQITSVAETLNWRLNPSQIDKGVALLKKLYLVRE